MKYALVIGLLLCLCACGGSKTYHTVSVKKPIYHHSWYKNSRWHKRQIGPVRVHLHIFEKQGVKTVRMKG